MSQQQSISWKGGKIFFRVKGQGKVLVLLHGFLGASSVFQKILPALSKKFCVITIDLPGHGKSSSFGYLHTMDFMSDAVVVVLNHLKVENCFVLGHSMGGYVSLELARKQKQLVRAICLLNSISFPDSVEKKKDRDRAIIAVKSNHNIYIRQTISNLFSAPHFKNNQAQFRLALKLAETTSVRGLLAALEGMKLREDFSAFVQSQLVPVFWIKGKHDKVFTTSDVEKHLKLFPASNVFTLENAGHMAMLEEHRKCVELILSVAN